MNIALFAPNAGVSFSTGGGSNFGLKLAELLLNDGHTVGLAGYHSLPIATLDALHGTGVARFRDRIRTFASSSSDPAFSVYRSLPVKLSAYSGLLSPRFASWVGRVFAGFQPDAVVFQDDIPVAAVPFLKGRRASLYIHYPFLGLRSDLIPPLRSVLTRTEWANDRILTRLATRLLVSDPTPLVDVIWTNSSITSRIVSTLWPTARPVYAPTYVRPPDGGVLPELRRSRAVALGTVQKAKNYLELVGQFAAVREKLPGAELFLGGYLRDVAYLRQLRRRVRLLALGGNVQIAVDLSRDRVRAELNRSRVIVHVAPFEPFGLSLLEGMSHGCIPLVAASEYAGGWVDIVNRGEFGIGFRTGSEFAERLPQLLQTDGENEERRARALARAQAFSPERLGSLIRPHFSTG